MFFSSFLFRGEILLPARRWADAMEEGRRREGGGGGLRQIRLREERVKEESLEDILPVIFIMEGQEAPLPPYG